MGWHRFGPKGQGVTGDAPADIASDAVQRMADAYVERFGRPPLLAEVLHAFRTVVTARADELLYDPESVATDWPEPRLPDEPPLDLDAFEAAWCDRPEPDGQYLISRRATGEDVVACAMGVTARTMRVDYDVLGRDLGERDAERLVLYTLVRDLLGESYAHDVDRVSIASTQAPGARADFGFPGRGSRRV